MHAPAPPATAVPAATVPAATAAAQAAPADPVDNEAARLARLAADFPQFRIWREVIADHARSIACGLRPGVHPHTVVAAELGELREALAAGQPVTRSARRGS
jgi:hypothetical protein